MTDQELRELVASLAVSHLRIDAKLDRLAESQTRTDAQLAQTDAQLAKTDAKLDRLAEMYGGVGNNQGAVAEEFFFNTLKAKPDLNGIHYDFIDKNVTRYQDGIEDEFDILLVNGQDISIIEVKYRAHPKDLERLITKIKGQLSPSVSSIYKLPSAFCFGHIFNFRGA